MKKILALFLSLSLTASLPGLAQTNWTLKNAIDYGLQHFGTVRIAQYQTETANQQARQALGLYLPQVSATGNFTDNLKLQSTLLPAGPGREHRTHPDYTGFEIPDKRECAGNAGDLR